MFHMEQLTPVSAASERWYNMSIIRKITLFESFNKVHKLIMPLYIIEYDSGTLTTAYSFMDLPKRAKKIIKTSHYDTGYNHKFTEIDGTLRTLHITEYERL